MKTPGFPVICAGGIGDCLLAFQSLPLHLASTLGLNLDFYYTTPGHPAEATIRQFALSLPRARWMSQPPKLVHYRLRNFFQRLHLGPLTPPIPGWRPPGFLPRRGPMNILLQTHLDGHHGFTSVHAKTWTVEAWSEIIHLLRDFLDAQIHLLEWHQSSRTALLRTSPHVLNAIQPDLLSQCLYIQTMDLIISVDSWAKYPARWAGLPQVIIIPDLRQNYTPAFQNISANQIAQVWFQGLTNRTDTFLIGLECRHSSWKWTLPSIHQLQPTQILHAVQSILPYCRRPFFDPTIPA